MGLDMSVYSIRKNDLEKYMKDVQEEKRLYDMSDEEIIAMGGKEVYWDVLEEHNSFKWLTEVMYWRKVNAIHKWFVDTLQGGVDDCRLDMNCSITLKQCEELRDLCYKAVNSKHPEKYLPTCSGFFFGSTEYNEGYKEDLDNTIDFLEKVIGATTSKNDSDYDLNVVNMVYSSSW